jgi:hypothetical protein
VLAIHAPQVASVPAVLAPVATATAASRTAACAEAVQDSIVVADLPATLDTPASECARPVRKGPAPRDGPVASVYHKYVLLQ